MSECRKCKNWHDCKAPPGWFHYGEIRFCPYQCLWILSHAETLKGGDWPAQAGQAESPKGQRQFKAEASFVKPEIIIGELENRLATTGIQGKLLVAQAFVVRNINDLKDQELLDWEAREALMYIKGWRRKNMSFRAWRKKRRYRQNVHPNGGHIR